MKPLTIMNIKYVTCLQRNETLQRTQREEKPTTLNICERELCARLQQVASHNLFHFLVTWSVTHLSQDLCFLVERRSAGKIKKREGERTAWKLVLAEKVPPDGREGCVCFVTRCYPLASHQHMEKVTDRKTDDTFTSWCFFPVNTHHLLLHRLMQDVTKLIIAHQWKQGQNHTIKSDDSA